MGTVDSTPESESAILPALQNRSVISVVVGDYHYGALTSTGKLLTWGEYSKGALGLGNPAAIEVGLPGGFAEERHRRTSLRLGRRTATPPSVKVPTEIRFDRDLKKPKEMFCFAATASGWHTGALVMDLEVCIFVLAFVQNSFIPRLAVGRLLRAGRGGFDRGTLTEHAWSVSEFSNAPSPCVSRPWGRASTTGRQGIKCDQGRFCRERRVQTRILRMRW
jgi:hypothetical protein